MSILYWGRGRSLFQACLSSCCESGGHSGRIAEAASVDELRLAIVTRRAEIHLVVLAPPAMEDLVEVISLESLLSGMPVIILLPDDDQQTIALTHRLHPRFAAVLDGDLENASLVAASILKIRAAAGPER